MDALTLAAAGSVLIFCGLLIILAYQVLSFVFYLLASYFLDFKSQIKEIKNTYEYENWYRHTLSYSPHAKRKSFFKKMEQ